MDMGRDPKTPVFQFHFLHLGLEMNQVLVLELMSPELKTAN